MREINRVIVSAVILSKDSKILFGKKDQAKGGVYSDCWHIPGGGIDEGEDKIECVIREVQEETGLDISNEKIVFLDDSDKGQAEKVLKDTGEKVLCNMVFNVYRVDLNQNSEDVPLESTDDLVELKWVSMDELKRIKLTPPSIKLFRKMGLL